MNINQFRFLSDSNILKYVFISPVYRPIFFGGKSAANLANILYR